MGFWLPDPSTPKPIGRGPANQTIDFTVSRVYADVWLVCQCGVELRAAGMPDAVEAARHAFDRHVCQTTTRRGVRRDAPR